MFPATKQREDAHKEQGAVQTIVIGLYPERLIMGINTASNLLSMAAQVVAGDLTVQQDKTPAAVQYLKKSVVFQDQLQCDEPRPGTTQGRQSLGAVSPTAGKAGAMYQEELKHNPRNA